MRIARPAACILILRLYIDTGGTVPNAAFASVANPREALCSPIAASMLSCMDSADVFSTTGNTGIKYSASFPPVFPLQSLWLKTTGRPVYHRDCI